MKLRVAGLAIAIGLGCVQYAHAAPPPLVPDGTPAAQTAQPNNPPPPPAADPATKEKSRAAFRRGVAQIKASDWQGARASFEEAYALVPHPSILLNLGISRLKTGDPVLAEQDLTKFLSDDTGSMPDEQQSARDALVEAKKQIGTLRITTAPTNATVTIDGNALTMKDGIGDLRVKPGYHTVNAQADGFAPFEKSVDVAAKGESRVDIALIAGTKPPPPPGGDKPTDGEGLDYRKIGGYGLGGLAGVGLVAMTIMGLRAISLSSAYGDKTNPGYQQPDTKSEGITFRTGADVCLIIAILAGTGAGILLFTDIGKDSPAPAADPNATPKPASAQIPTLFRW